MPPAVMTAVAAIWYDGAYELHRDAAAWTMDTTVARVRIQPVSDSAVRLTAHIIKDAPEDQWPLLCDRVVRLGTANRAMWMSAEEVAEAAGVSERDVVGVLHRRGRVNGVAARLQLKDIYAEKAKRPGAPLWIREIWKKTARHIDRSDSELWTTGG